MNQLFNQVFYYFAGGITRREKRTTIILDLKARVSKRKNLSLPLKDETDQTIVSFGQNIRLITDIMKVTELESIPGLAIFIDFKKAFDSVDWNFLFRTLQAFNFGPCIQKWPALYPPRVMAISIQKWIRTFYTNCSSCFTNNGFVSQFFTRAFQRKRPS